MVFARFSRGSTASHSGSGLGLALVAQQAHLHRGTASLEDSPRGGARLLLRIPAPTVKQEMARAGYRLQSEQGFLPNQYFLVFRRD